MITSLLLKSGIGTRARRAGGGGEGEAISMAKL